MPSSRGGPASAPAKSARSCAGSADGRNRRSGERLPHPHPAGDRGSPAGRLKSGDAPHRFPEGIVQGWPHKRPAGRDSHCGSSSPKRVPTPRCWFEGLPAAIVLEHYVREVTPDGRTGHRATWGRLSFHARALPPVPRWARSRDAPLQQGRLAFHGTPKTAPNAHAGKRLVCTQSQLCALIKLGQVRYGNAKHLGQFLLVFSG